MSPTKPTPSSESASPAPMPTHKPEAKIRKRVRKACDRCRIKKTKCDGSSPCLRCKTDNVICCAKESHRLRRRNYPPGYAEMLERQHAQLVSCVQELYQRLRESGSWDQSLPENSKRQPSVHDILAALDLLEPKDDGSRELEPFNEVVTLTQSDNDSPASPLDGVSDNRNQPDSKSDQRKSPMSPSKDTTPFFPEILPLETHSRASSKSRSSPPDLSTDLPPEQPTQIKRHVKTSQTPPIQTHAEHISSQAQLFANLASTPIHRNIYDTSSSVPIQYSASTPSLSLDMSVIRPNYLSMAAPPDQLPFCHDWARSGITVDSSDFSTDFRRLGQLDVARVNLEHAALVPDIP